MGSPRQRAIGLWGRGVHLRKGCQEERLRRASMTDTDFFVRAILTNGPKQMSVLRVMTTSLQEPTHLASRVVGRSHAAGFLPTSDEDATFVTKMRQTGHLGRSRADRREVPRVLF